jgi:class 3 adenylate cyclase/tetratricopeptide (TPR) repeat protein/type II secretory pathway predicted ATPase ExeA
VECGLCGTANREGARFCGGCGSPLPRQCRTCKAELDPSLRFCDQCGTPVETTGAVAAPPAPQATLFAGINAVRKTVTVLFADIGGSTGFGERTDPEVARQVLARYHALLQDAIDAHRGRVAKFMGDGMMATFGIPEIAEDDAERAVRAGIEIQDRFEQFAAEVAEQHGETLTARVGVNTGEVVIGAGDADLVGDALNVAARLEKACRPGHVLVGDETWRLTRGVLAYESLGEVTVAGRAEPVGTYEVASSETRAAEPVAPFVGRDHELDRLMACFDHARADHRAVLATVLGSAGLGKTRLSRELASRASERDAATFEIRCDRAGGETFAPIADLVRTATGLEDTESDRDGFEARTRIGTLLDGELDRDRVVDVLAGVLGVAPARSVEETFWAVRRLLEALAAARPVLVVVDDIQWAEPKLLDLLEHLGEWLTDAPVLLVALARPELRELRPSLVESGRRVADVVALDGLDSGATEALASGLLGSALPRELVDRLPASTDGNPLFVRELVRMLVDDRVIRRTDDGTWELAIDADAVEVPPTIQSLLSARIERLPADELHVLELASVVGAEFSVGALRELAGDDLPIPALLERLRRKELVEPTGAYWGDEPVHRFHHVLIRDAAYRRLLKGTRAELHQRIGEWTDVTSGQVVGEHETAIAFHFEQAHRYRTELDALDEETDRLGRRAAELLGVAGRRALERDDLAAAGALVRRALAVLPTSETGTRSELLLMACECLLASGDVAAGAPLVDELSGLGATDDKLGAWAACFLAQLVGLTDPDGLVDAEATATAAAETLRSLGDGAGEAKAQQVRALLLARLGRVGEAEGVLDLALGAARAVDDRRRVTAVLGTAPQAALFGPSPVARAGGRCLDVVRLLRITTASPSVEATSMRCQAVLEALRGRFDVSRSMLASARASLEELGLRHGLLETDLFTGMVELLADDPGAAVAPLRAAYQGLETLGVGADAGRAAALLATALLAQGEIDEAELTAAASEALAGQNLQTAIAWRTAKAAVLAARGELAAAVALARKAVDIAAATDLVLDHADACVVLADLREQAGDATGAREARVEARRLYEAKGATVPAERLEVAAREPAVAPTTPTNVVAPSNRASRAFERATTLMHVDVDQASALFAAGIVYETRESGPRAAIRNEGRAALRVVVASLASTYDAMAVEPIAVRGERHALVAHSLSRAGFRMAALNVIELDSEGLITHLTTFDEDDRQAAITQLDEPYLAGEGAPHPPVLEPALRFMRAHDDRDWAALRSAIADEFVSVDHRTIGFGTAGPDEFVESCRVGADDVPVYTQHSRTLRCLGRAVITSNVGSGVRDDGGRFEWATQFVVQVDGDGLVARLEWFDEGDETAGRRLHELAESSAIGPPLENAAIRASGATIAALDEYLRTGDPQDVDVPFADGFRMEDRRTIVAMPTQARGDLSTVFDTMREQGYAGVSDSVIAIRGDRLCLTVRTFTTASGDATTSVAVTELDEELHLARVCLFSEDDLPDALEELDRRYALGEGIEHLRVLHVCGTFQRASVSENFDALRAVLAPDMVMVDHNEVGFHSGGVEHYLAITSARPDLYAFETITRTIELLGSTVLATHDELVTGARRDDSYGPSCSLLHVDPNDRIDRLEWWPLDRYADARARLHELGTPASGIRVENAASRTNAELLRLIKAGDWAGAAEMHALAENVVRVDRRRLVAAPAIEGATDFTLNAAAFLEVFDRVEPEVVAVRGDRLALLRLHCGRAPDFVLRILCLYEHDPDGRLVWEADYDDEDIADALAELDQHYLAGEGAAHGRVLRICRAFGDANERRDFDAMRDMLAADFVMDDRTRLGYGEGDRDYFDASSRTRADVSPADGVSINRVLLVEGDALLTFAEGHHITPEGSDYAWVSCIVFQVGADDLIHRAEYFDESDMETAVERLHELGGAATARLERPTPAVENAATRLIARASSLMWTDLEGTLDLFAPDAAGAARESGPSRDLVATNREMWRDVVSSFVHTYDEVHFTPLAVRGERVALLRQEFVVDGYASLNLTVLAIDEQERIARIETFGDDDVVASLAALEAWHLESLGDAATPADRGFSAASIAANRRDPAAYERCMLPDVAMVDHLPLAFPPASSSRQLRRMLERLYELAPDTLFVTTKLVTSERASIGVMEQRSTMPQGNEHRWVRSAVQRYASDGRVERIEYLPEDRWDEAVARFHAWSAATATDEA